MKKITSMLTKILPAMTACAAFILTVNANSSTCFIFGQPKAPKGLDEFRRLK